jgi:hypothetical protein
MQFWLTMLEMYLYLHYTNKRITYVCKIASDTYGIYMWYEAHLDFQLTNQQTLAQKLCNRNVQDFGMYSGCNNSEYRRGYLL